MSLINSLIHFCGGKQLDLGPQQHGRIRGVLDFLRGSTAAPASRPPRSSELELADG